ncbi:MAG: DUF4129 domain-containing protein [Burkholderiales bacterium]
MAGTLVLAGVLAGGAARAATPSPPPEGTPTREQVEAAAATVRADPNLPGIRTGKTLRFKEHEKKSDRGDSDNDRYQWISEFFSAVSQGARLLVGLVGALAVGWLIWRIRHWVKLRAAGGLGPGGPPPSHVGALDIRPESLPADVGAAAAALWRQECHRAALSLLYRGALSRLVHVQEVPIRAASTEGECVALASARLAARSRSFFEQLVANWQALAYGGRIPDGAVVLALCAEFDARLSQAIEPQPAPAYASKGGAA